MFAESTFFYEVVVKKIRLYIKFTSLIMNVYLFNTGNMVETVKNTLKIPIMFEIEVVKN